MPGLFKTLFVVMAVCLPAYGLLRVLVRRAARRQNKAAGSSLRELLMAAFVLFMAGLLVLVLQPAAGAAPVWERLSTGEGINLVPGRTIGEYMWYSGARFHINIVGNVAMFVPLGFCLPLLWRRWRPFWKMALVAVAFPVGIETAQLFVGRSTDIDDVILNAAGILLGYGLCRLAVWAIKPLARLNAGGLSSRAQRRRGDGDGPGAAQGRRERAPLKG